MENGKWKMENYFIYLESVIFNFQLSIINFSTTIETRNEPGYEGITPRGFPHSEISG